MTEQHVLAALAEAIGDECGERGMTLSEDMVAADIPGWDSMAHIRIMMNLEARLGTEVDIDKSYRAKTIGDLVRIVLDG